MVEVTHAVPGEHAVVLPLEDADVAGGAVPGSGRSHSLADSAVVPVLPPQPRTGDHNVPGAGVNQPERGKHKYQIKKSTTTTKGLEMKIVAFTLNM